MSETQALIDAIDADGYVERLKAWSGIESPTSDADAVNRMMDAVAADAEADGLHIARTPGRDGYADHLTLSTEQTDAPGVLIVAHVDTVHPVGTLSELPIRIEGDRLYGPGVLDMKGGLLAAMEGLRALRRLGRAPALPVRFVVVSDEEMGTPTGRTLIEAASPNAVAALVVESARDGGKIVTARKGTARYWLRATGKPAHSGSRHQDGASAIREIAAKVVGLEAMTNYGTGLTVNVGVVEAGTAVNVIPARAAAYVDVRLPDLEMAAEVDSRIQGLKAEIPGVELVVEGGLNRPPMERTADVSRLFDHAAGLADEIGFLLESVPQTGGGSDGNFTGALGVPTLDGLGPDGAGPHTLEEHILLSSIRPRCALLARLMETVGEELFQ